MGGPGSGRWDRPGKRDTAEEHKRLDVRWMARRGYLRPGSVASVSWTCGGRPSGDIRVVTLAGRVELAYRWRYAGGEWSDVRQSVSLDSTPCTFGGSRPWFICPGCKRRAAILYGAGRLFLCRKCHGLAYESQQLDAPNRAMQRAHKLRRRLGGHQGGLVDDYPGKPKGMHWRTYDRLLEALVQAEERWTVGLIDWLGRADRRFGQVIQRSIQAAKSPL